MKNALSKLEHFVCTVDPAARVRPFGSFAMHISVKGSDIDCAVVTSCDKDVMKSALMREYGADEARDDVFTRLVAEIDGVMVDLSIHEPRDRILHQRLFGVEAFASRLQSDTAPHHRKVILLLKHWAKQRLVYGLHLGYLNSIILVEMYFAKLREIESSRGVLKTLERFFDCYSGMSFERFNRMQWETTKKGALRIFIDEHSWRVIRTEMSDSLRWLRRGDIGKCFAMVDLCRIKRDYDCVFSARERLKPPMIESGIKYLAKYFARGEVRDCRIVKQDEKIYVMLNGNSKERRSSTCDTFESGMIKFGKSFSEYGGEQVCFERDLS